MEEKKIKKRKLLFFLHWSSWQYCLILYFFITNYLALCRKLESLLIPGDKKAVHTYTQFPEKYGYQSHDLFFHMLFFIFCKLTALLTRTFMWGRWNFWKKSVLSCFGIVSFSCWSFVLSLLIFTSTSILLLVCFEGTWLFFVVWAACKAVMP